MSHTIEVDTTNHSDPVPRHRIVGSKLWIVPERVQFEDVEERMFLGVCILYSSVNRRHRCVGVGGTTVEYQAQEPHDLDAALRPPPGRNV